LSDQDAVTILPRPCTRSAPTAIRSQFFHTLNWPLGAALTVVFIVLGGLAIAAVGYAFARASRDFGTLGLRQARRQP